MEAGEITPGAAAPVLLARGDGIHPELLTWGYRMPRSLVINARAETAEEKPLFRESVASARCVVPCAGFYAWDQQKRKYLFTLPGEGALYMAGLYDVKAGRPCYVVLTTEANASMREIHPRMPLVLTKEQAASWLTEPGTAGKYLRMTPPLLERTAVDGQTCLW